MELLEGVAEIVCCLTGMILIPVMTFGQIEVEGRNAPPLAHTNRWNFYTGSPQGRIILSAMPAL